MATLTTLAQVKDFFARNTQPYYFVSATPFNLLGIENWAQNFHFISLIDVFDGKHPNLISPKRLTTPVFNSLEDINLYILEHRDILLQLPAKSKVVFLFFSPKLEALCQQLDLDICLPAHTTVQKVDSKIFTTQLGNKAGVHSVPNILTKVDSFSSLESLAKTHDLGAQWVIQTAYGDSGKTTFFISSEEEYQTHAKIIESEPLVKVMKRIRCVSLAIEACATRCGTFVGPLMSELIGVPDLTPYPGGWCGNDLNSALPAAIRAEAMSLTEKLGNALYQEGYKGYFEVDYLLDLETQTLYLGELNPRISGITAITNLSAVCQNYLPLFLFHLLEFSDVSFDIDPKLYNAHTLEEGACASSQLILKYKNKDLQMIEKSPASGVYTLQNGKLLFKQSSTNRLDASGLHEGFLFRIMEQGEYAYYGGDLAILFLPAPLLESGKLTPQAQIWIQALKNLYVLRPLTQEEKELIERYQNPGLKLK